MRTTIHIDEQLLIEAKLRATRQGKTLTRVIEEALRESFALKPDSGPRQPVNLPTFTGKGLLPGVDLDDSAALYDLMDTHNDPA
jgi:hypothetical protein